jgi:hypothetical protein
VTFVLRERAEQDRTHSVTRFFTLFASTIIDLTDNDVVN